MVDILPEDIADIIVKEYLHPELYRNGEQMSLEEIMDSDVINGVIPQVIQDLSKEPIDVDLQSITYEGDMLKVGYYIWNNYTQCSDIIYFVVKDVETWLN